MEVKSPPGFVCSLDLELFWGIMGRRSKDRYGANILGVRDAVPAILQLFKQHDVACTWAVVGILFAKNKKDLLNFIPEKIPFYEDRRLDPYSAISEIGNDERSDPYHYGRSLIDKIREVSKQEVGTHTFGHFNCLEKGATPETFAADIKSAIAIMARDGIQPRSIVFPRNQFDDAYIRKCAENGIDVIRGTEPGWLYKTAARADQSRLRRALRLADTYCNLSGTNSHNAELLEESTVTNVASSRFLRPWNGPLWVAEPLKLRRITSAMKKSAKNGEFFHLWFHPHNFGKDLGKNIQMLSSILVELDELRSRFEWPSMTMKEAAGVIRSDFQNVGI